MLLQYTKKIPFLRRALETEEKVRGCQVEEAQRMGLDKFSEIQKGAKLFPRFRYSDAQNGITRFSRCQRMRNRTDTADSFNQRGHFIIGTPLAEFFKAPELSDMEGGILDMTVFIQLDRNFSMPFNSVNRVDKKTDTSILSIVTMNNLCFGFQTCLYSNNMMKTATITVCGVVQGVGFRPFVHGLACEYDLKGWVRNRSGSVDIEAEGTEAGLNSFLESLESRAPSVAYVEKIDVTYHPPKGHRAFEIRKSLEEGDGVRLVSPDIAMCGRCRQEISDPGNRRFQYPFTNCTHCGPRFSIIEEIPYDRPKTTMRRFSMCPDCRREYENPSDRRFHAQPNACPSCGPSLRLTDSNGTIVACDNVVQKAAALLRSDKILAIRGLAGFHLACDAGNEKTVELLRRRKHRPAKPFAVMLADLEMVGKYCQVSSGEAELLTSRQSPIVLLDRLKNIPGICSSIAPNLNSLGVILPYTPLHYLLLAEIERPLVMTSGNISGEPVLKDNDEALGRLGEIADFFLLHDREIHARSDDSIAFVSDGGAHVVRRARGYAPYPVLLPFRSKQILACGAEEKNTFCMARDSHAFLSPHIGELSSEQTFMHFEKSIELYRTLFRIDPEIVACDMHPDYPSTKFAKSICKKQNLELVAVQHHHAHIASCMVENSVKEPVIGIAFDGTGYGTDGAIWGGEFLLADYSGFRRMGHIQYVRMPGGGTAVRKPYRMALGYIFELLGMDFNPEGLAIAGYASEFEIIRQQLARDINSPRTSSAGRLFDGVSALLGIRETIAYEAQAATELEMKALEMKAGEDIPCLEPYDFDIADKDGMRIIGITPLIEAVVRDIRSNISVSTISMKFHVTVAHIIENMCRLISSDTGLKRVALSGGVFQNRLLLRMVLALLRNDGFEVHQQRLVPCNDGGISLGQTVVANYVSGNSRTD